MAVVSEIIMAGTAAAKPAASSSNDGYLYFETDTGLFKRSNGSAWVTVSDAGATIYTDEKAQDAVGGMVADTDTVDITYTDATPELKADVKKQMSITSDSSGLKLVNDETSPGNDQVYGTDGSGVKGWKNDPSGGGGGRTLIAEVTPSGVSTVTVASSIVGTYKKLVIEFVIRSTNATTNVSIDVIFNTDTTDANYRRTIDYGYATGSVGAVGDATNQIGDVIQGANSPANSFAMGILEIPQYANTGFNKHIIGVGSHRRDDSSVFELAWNWAMEWESTAAITQIDMTLSAGNFTANSVIRLYGES